MQNVEKTFVFVYGGDLDLLNIKMSFDIRITSVIEITAIFCVSSGLVLL